MLQTIFRGISERVCKRCCVRRLALGGGVSLKAIEAVRKQVKHDKVTSRVNLLSLVK